MHTYFTVFLWKYTSHKTIQQIEIFWCIRRNKRSIVVVLTHAGPMPQRCASVRSALHRWRLSLEHKSLDEPSPACSPGAAEMQHLIGGLPQRHRTVMRPERLPLDDQAVIEQDMQRIEQRQLGAAPRPRAGREGAADLALQRPRVALDGDLVEEPLDLPIHCAKAGG